ncbi:AP-4 complex subunit beta-1 isoform X2 [Neoarius graeffei]|uniref:AP-4 complex subunit beta-1 isoform X2 n=1 Tax=Neoarius graeffei TaxID=443677 RepID=UPI00298C743F|nr:AP-4 complex subunit beta-1 isoform X2 [Neoarius graeffei]
MPYFGCEETVKDLKRALSNPNVQADRLRYRNYITQVIRCMTEGVDVSSVFMEMVKASATVDVVQKKLVFLYMVTFAGVKPDMALLAINTLRKDCDNPNPMIRGLALRNMCNLRMPGIIEYIHQPVMNALRDKSSYVRRVAVLGCAKIHSLQPDAEIDGGTVNELYSLLRDPDPVVMVNCLRALEEILHHEGGVVINKPIAHHLITRLKDLDSWSQSEVLTFLLRYRPRNDDELFDILSLLDTFLLSAQPPVMAATLRLFLHLAAAHPTVQADALTRARGPLLAACAATAREMRFTALCHVQQVLRSQPTSYGSHYKRFFCAFSEPTYVKLRKMEILVELVNDENVALILEELKSYCTDVSTELAQAAIKAIGRIGQTYTEKCLEILTGLLALKQEHITSAVLQTYRDLAWFCPQSTAAVCHAIEGCDDLPQDDEGKQALLWLLGVHGDQISSAPYVLEGFIDRIKMEISSAVKMELLTASLKLFLSRPAETQDMLGRLLHYCIEEDGDMCVHDRALLYYRLLQCGVNETRKVLLGPKSDPSMTIITGRTEEPVNHWASSFNTLDPLLGAESRAQDVPAEISDGDDEIRINDPDQAFQNGTLREGDTNHTPDAPEEPKLSLSPLVSHDAFEKLWMELPVLHHQCLGVPRPSVSPDTLNSAFQLVKIQILAYSRSDARPWKLYMYSWSGGSLILAELLEDGADNPHHRGNLTLSIKQHPEEQEAVEGFVSVVLNVLRTLSSVNSN